MRSTSFLIKDEIMHVALHKLKKKEKKYIAIDFALWQSIASTVKNYNAKHGEI